MDALFSKVGLADVHHDVLRNIVSLRVSEDLFDDLSDDHEAWVSAQQLELNTKPPIFTNNFPIIHRPFEEAEWNTAIGFPFMHTSISRYSDGTFGVWYGAGDLETTVHETAYHWRNKLLADAEGFLRPGVSVDRKVYQVRCDAALIDFRPIVSAHPDIVHPNDYTLTHAVGHKINREGHPGLVSESARCNGEVYAVFTPNVLSDVRHACFLTYITTQGGVEVQKESGKTWRLLKR
jgi:hypothetical protein